MEIKERIKTCPVCNKQFNAYSHTCPRKCCSEECSKKHYENLKRQRKAEACKIKNEIRIKTCKQCGKQFTVKRYESGDYCSKICMKFHTGCMVSKCLECGTDFINNKHGTQKYCCHACSSIVMSRRAAKKLEEKRGTPILKEEQDKIRKIDRKQKERFEIEKRLRLFRNLKSCKAVSDYLGEHETTCSTILRKSKQYLKRMQKRSSNSLWRKDGENGNNLSKLFKFESDFNKELVIILNKSGAIADGETSVPGGTRRRVDVFVSTLLGKFCIESKISRRTNCVDECLGQVMVKSIYLDAKPVMAFPSDLQLDPVIVNAARSLGIRIVNEKTIVQELII